jgi:hypothetical protein
VNRQVGRLRRLRSRECVGAALQARPREGIASNVGPLALRARVYPVRVQTRSLELEQSDSADPPLAAHGLLRTAVIINIVAIAA